MGVGPSRVWRGAQGSGISGAQGRRCIKAPCGRAAQLVKIQYFMQTGLFVFGQACLRIIL